MPLCYTLLCVQSWKVEVKGKYTCYQQQLHSKEKTATFNPPPPSLPPPRTSPCVSAGGLHNKHVLVSVSLSLSLCLSVCLSLRPPPPPPPNFRSVSSSPPHFFRLSFRALPRTSLLPYPPTESTYWFTTSFFQGRCRKASLGV